MNELPGRDQDEMAQVLSHARRALSPTPAQEARLLQRTLHAASAVPAATPLAAKWLVALTIAGVSGSLGFVLGRQVEHTVVTPAVVAAPRPLEVPREAASPAPTEEEAHVEPAPKVHRPRLKSAPVAPVAVEPPSAAPSSLELEIRAMKDVERALRDNDPGQALQRLDQLDQEVPHGSLTEERSAASVIARCRLGLGTRAKLIEEFSASYPNSGYAQRVQTSCRRP